MGRYLVTTLSSIGAWKFGWLILAVSTGKAVLEAIKNAPSSQSRRPSQRALNVSDMLAKEKSIAENQIQNNQGRHCESNCLPNCQSPMGTICFSVHKTPPSRYNGPCNIPGVHIGHIHII